MTRLISTDEQIPIHIDNITIYVSPLSYMDKMELQDYMMKAVEGDLKQAMKGAAMAIKYAVKDIDGVKDSQGKKFKLDFEDNKKHLTDSCVDNLLNLPQNNKLIVACSALLEGLPSEGIKNPSTGEMIEGISIGDVVGKRKKPKKVLGN